eukprot:TRINITY_DN2836_c0_g1_i1.p3 TRINITY_DN2836_c0_g1~~TRINITY_DN2836_c0_g1_i1.p3  ORF type:complete len:51 (+),score=11.92 TRINITY_DN2836_c0_g1_i1:1076-1228(+)
MHRNFVRNPNKWIENRRGGVVIMSSNYDSNTEIDADVAARLSTDQGTTRG